MWATCLGAAAGMFRSRGGAAILMLLTAFLTMEHLMPEASYDAASIPAAAQISLIVLAVTGTMAALAWIAWQWRGELRALHLPALVPAKVPAKVG